MSSKLVIKNIVQSKKPPIAASDYSSLAVTMVIRPIIGSTIVCIYEPKIGKIS